MRHKEPGFFDADNRLRVLSSLGNQLEKLDGCIEWEDFRPLLNKAFKNSETAKSSGGRPPFDFVLRYKVLILQKLYDLSDDQAEYQINDRRTFMSFLGLYEQDKVPDAKSIWLWREILMKKKAFHKLFKRFWKMLEEKGVEASKGEIIDATFVDVPRQRNSRDENNQIKEGNIPEKWKKSGNESMLRQKDVDARWTKKNNEKHYGYKNHVKVDKKTKLVKVFMTTPASTHDSQTLDELTKDSKEGTTVYADSAYVGKENIELLEGRKLQPRINEKGYRNRPLTEKQKKSNRKKSKTRARVEHVFAFMTMTMKATLIRSIGIARAEAQNALANLVYNLCRYSFLKRAGYAN
jgi:IS5 family transposase